MRLLSLAIHLLGVLLFSTLEGAAALPGSFEVIPANRINEIFGERVQSPGQQNGLVEDELGIPVEAARILLDGEEVAASDEAGVFRLPLNLKTGTVYALSIQRNGYEFIEPVRDFQVGNSPVFKGREVEPLSDSCFEVPQAEYLVLAAQFAGSLRKETLSLVNQVPRKAKLKLLSGEVITATELPQRVEEQFATFSFFSVSTPEVDFQCGPESSCATYDAREAKIFLGLELDNLSHERLLINRILRQRGKITPTKARSVIRSVTVTRSRVKRALRNINDLIVRCR